MSSSQAEAVKPAAPSIPFSYAQAARGKLSNPASAQSSKAPSGAITPAKEQSAVPGLKSELNGARWADSIDDEIKETSHSSASTAVDIQSTSTVKFPAAHTAGQVNGVASPSSVDFGGSSTSTLVRDDAPSPMAEMPESAWEFKSQSASTVKADNSRSRSSADRASSKGRKKSGRRSEKKEKADPEAAASKTTWTASPVKYVDAPAPIVNVWQLRAQQVKAPVTSKPSVTSNPASASVDAFKTTATDEPKSATPVVPIPSAVGPSTRSKEATKDTPSRKPQLEEKGSGSKNTRQAVKAVAEGDQASKAASPAVDQVSWPTPETTLVDEPRKKPQEKIEAEAQPSHAPKVKHAWEKVDFTPSVVFHTPLPGQARRGGKGGGRGVREGPPRTNATGQNDRRGDSSTGAQNGEPARRDRSEAARSASPGRGKRHSNDEGSVRRGSRQESLARGVSAKSADDIKSKPTDNVEQDAPKLSNTLRSKTSRKEQAAIYGERLKDETVGGKENSTAVQSKGAMPQPPTGQQASPTSTEFRKPDVSPAVSSERKGSVATDISSRNHERKNSASYSSYSGRPRPDRGRGGHRGGRGNGHTFHPNAHSFVNGQSGAFPIQSFNNLPKSPTGFGQDPFYGQTPQHSQRYGRNFPSRASSIPTDGSYPRIPNGYPSQPLQINTGVQGSGMYPPDYYMPATAVPYQNDPTSHLIDAVSTQMEYYFSVDNLLKDLYLRKHMDSQGFVLLSFIAEFKRLKSMTTDLEMIKYVCQQSPNIEHRIGSDGIDRLRAAKAWENWVLPKGERDRTAQHDGPDCLHQPPHPHPQLPEQSHLLRHSSLPISQSAGPVLGGQAFQSLNSFAAPYTYVPSASAETPAVAQFQTSPTNMGSSHSVAQPSAASSGSSSTQSQILNSSIQETEPDSFTDAEVDVLRVVFRNLEPADADSSSGGASHRTFSNGSAEGINGLRITTNPPARNSATPPSEPHRVTSPTASERVNRFLAGATRLTSPGNLSRNGTTHDRADDVPGIYWIKDKDSPAHDLPPESTSDLYLNVRDRAIQQHKFYQPCYDMNVMYQFWEHFLVRNFNARMYMEFRTFAMADASTRNDFQGLNSLLKYYGKAMSHDVPIRRTVAHDYVSLVKSEPIHSDRPAFKQLRAAWRDGALNMKNRKRVKDFLDKAMEQELDR